MDKEPYLDKRRPISDEMKTQDAGFVNSQGQKLAAKIDLPKDRRPACYAVFAHCFTCNKHYKAPAYISQTLVKNGWGVLRFDFTGLGESEGAFEDTNFSTNVDDIVGAAQYLEKDYAAPTVLIGHSFGGAAVLQAAGRIAKAAAVVTIGSPADPRHVMHLLADSTSVIEQKGQANIVLEGRRFTIKKQFIEDLDNARMTVHIGNLNKALLILHAPTDAIVGIDNAAQIFKAARHPKSFIALDGADHLLTSRDDAVYVGALISAWADKYIRFRSD
jgi:alpha/beta superfamily hydrolase